MKFEEILRDLKNQQYRPIYFLHGEESYFIDVISDYIANHVLDEGERDFNQTILYGRDTDPDTIVEHAKRYPMMAPYQVVIVKEAQNIRKLDALQPYFENPLSTTVLVICHKHKSPDKRKAFYKSLSKNAVVLESKRLYENQVPTWVQSFLKSRNYGITPKASMLLTEFLGTDLSKIANELEKLMLNVPAGTEINPHHIEMNIGISKDYNTFELQDALSKKDILKANRIVTNFAQNSKDHPLVVTLSSLYGYFSKLLTYHFMKDRTDQKVASALRVHPFFVKDYKAAARVYSPRKTVDIIGYLKDYDLKSKGVNNTSTTDGELLKELIYKILH